MPHSVLLDELHLGLYAAAGLSDDKVDAVRHLINDRSFQPALRRAIKTFFRRYPALTPLRVKLSR